MFKYLLLFVLVGRKLKHMWSDESAEVGLCQHLFNLQPQTYRDEQKCLRSFDDFDHQNNSGDSE